jgi:hypothetical protein
LTKNTPRTLGVNKIIGITNIMNQNNVFHTENILTLNIFYL